MIVELILLGSLISNLGSDEDVKEKDLVQTPSPQLHPEQPMPVPSQKSLSLVPVQAAGSNAAAMLSNDVVKNYAAKPQNMDEVLKGFAADCQLGSDTVENLKRMADGADSLFSPFVQPKKIEVVTQLEGRTNKGFAYATEQTYLGLPLVSIYSLKDEQGKLTVGLITTANLEKAFESFLPELPTGVLSNLKIEQHPTQTNLVELSCAL